MVGSSRISNARSSLNLTKLYSGGADPTLSGGCALLKAPPKALEDESPNPTNPRPLKSLASSVSESEA